MRAIMILVAIVVLPTMVLTGAKQPPGSVFGVITDTTGRGLPGTRALPAALPGPAHGDRRQAPEAGFTCQPGA